MEKNEVLEKARKENKFGDENYMQESLRATTAGLLLGLMLCYVLGMSYTLITDNSSSQISAVTHLILMSSLFFKYTNLAVKFKKKSDVIWAVICGVMFVASVAIAFITFFILNK